MDRNVGNISQMQVSCKVNTEGVSEFILRTSTAYLTINPHTGAILSHVNQRFSRRILRKPDVKVLRGRPPLICNIVILCPVPLACQNLCKFVNVMVNVGFLKIVEVCLLSITVCVTQ